MQSGDDLVIAAIVHRRRLAYQAAKKRQKSGPQGKKRRPRSFFSWRDHLHRLSPRDFKLRYRLDLESFEHLHSLIVSRIETKNKNQVGAILFIDVSPQSDELVLINMIPPHQARRSRKGGAVSNRVRLAAGLRYLAGGQVTDLACCYHISKREVYSSLWLVVDAINDHPGFDISFPTNYCIDRRIAIELEQVAGASLIQPRVWMPTPEFDSEGRPVDFLDTFDHAAAPFGANSTREALKKCLSDNLLKRPREDSYTRAKRARGVP